MQLSSIPAKFTVPWASGAGGSYIRTIPTPSQIGVTNGAASFTDGFPPMTFLPVGSGGTPPFGQDFNGILNEVTAWNQWQQAGGPIRYDSVFQTAVGGYPNGAVVASVTYPGGYYISTLDNNTNGLVDNATSQTGWTYAFLTTGGSSIAAVVRAIPALIATANSSAGQSIAANTNVTMNSGFSTGVNTFANSTMSGGAFTVGTGEAGTYLISGACHLPTAVDNVFLNLSKNGSVVPAFSQQIAATNIIQNCNVVGFAQLSVGDIITLQVQQQNTGNSAETVNGNSLQLIRIGA